MSSKMFSLHFYFIHELVTKSSSSHLVSWLILLCIEGWPILCYVMLAPAGFKLPIILLTQPPKLQRLQA